MWYSAIFSMHLKRLLSTKPYYLLAPFLLALSACSSDEVPIKPKVMTITESVYASVIIEPESAYKVHSAVSGIVDQVFVEEGDSVKKGDVLLKILNSNPELNLENARLQLKMAQESYEGGSNVLNELKDEIEIASLKLENDSINFIKQKNLWSQNIGTRNTYEAKELAFKTSRSNLAILQNRYKRTIEDLETQLRVAKNNYQAALNTNEEHLIESLIDGKVYSLLKEPGEIINSQEPLAMIGKSNEFVIQLSVDEVDIAKVDLEQLVIVALDAYPSQTFQARVSKIYPQKNQATQTFQVEAIFSPSPERLFSGLSGEANIVISSKLQALVIPRDYLSSDGQVRTENGFMKVRTGLMDLENVEILSGIDTTTYLYLPKQ
ncbi:efflux RND transporter periplasmic adaptor subunit [Roseivirga sp.]|uniref:efflux RND transporter periplasmic adaptor subunit n=1 Tax=Roseivirga sp. TaxID=1964215 RepID=UPI003B52B5EF